MKEQPGPVRVVQRDGRRGFMACDARFRGISGRLGRLSVTSRECVSGCAGLLGRWADETETPLPVGADFAPADHSRQPDWQQCQCPDGIGEVEQAEAWRRGRQRGGHGPLYQRGPTDPGDCRDSRSAFARCRCFGLSEPPGWCRARERGSLRPCWRIRNLPGRRAGRGAGRDILKSFPLRPCIRCHRGDASGGATRARAGSKDVAHATRWRGQRVRPTVPGRSGFSIVCAGRSWYDAAGLQLGGCRWSTRAGKPRYRSAPEPVPSTVALGGVQATGPWGFPVRR